jgi:hypothetical protein
MRAFAIFVALLLAPLATAALSDLTIYAEGHYESQDEAPILVEWFHGNDDETKVTELAEMDRNGEITLLHWRTGAEEESGGLPDDDAKSRLMYHNITETPSVAIDGYPENISDIAPKVNSNEVEIEWNVQLIGSTEVELLNITATWTNQEALNGATQMHVFIIETEAVDSKGREVTNLVRDWATSSSFYLTNNTTNEWNETITKAHLDGAGIVLDDASHADRYEILLVMIGGFENDTSNRVLCIQRAEMPTYWQSVDQSATLTPAIFLILVVVCIGFIVLAERKRELGLPRLEGSWSSEENVIEYRLVTGNSIKIGELTMGHGWRANGKIKKENLVGGKTHNGTLRVTGSGALSLRLAVKVDDLGDWILDLNLPDPLSNN